MIGLIMNKCKLNIRIFKIIFYALGISSSPSVLAQSSITPLPEVVKENTKTEKYQYQRFIIVDIDEKIKGIKRKPAFIVTNNYKSVSHYFEKELDFEKFIHDEKFIFNKTYFYLYDISEKGEIVNARVEKGISPESDSIIVNVIKNIPKHKKGKTNGRTIERFVNIQASTPKKKK